MSHKDYQAFIAKKSVRSEPAGISVDSIHPALFPFQRDICRWNLRQGRSAVFAGTGLGKTVIQCEWARHVESYTKRPLLILAPLAVSHQTIAESEKILGLEVVFASSQGDVKDRGIYISNYQKLDRFDGEAFGGVVWDESSILKHLDSATRGKLIEMFARTPFKLAATATPAPNEPLELGGHAEALGIMRHQEMLSMFFVHDGGETQKWRLKGHAETDFWKWMCSWSVMLRKPSDLGYEDNGFILPELTIDQSVVESQDSGEFLFPMEAQSLQERIGARRNSIQERVAKCAEIANSNDEHWLVWCGLNDESDQLEKSITGAVQVTGSESDELKTEKMLKFSRGEIRVLVSKSSICGHGMNWQHCHNVAFVGLNDSWEAYFQAIRRCWRFGQKHPVKVHVITSFAEGNVVKNIKRKETDAEKMANEMLKHMAVMNKENLNSKTSAEPIYAEGLSIGGNWTMKLGDCVECVRSIKDESIGFSVYSPPFESLYCYSDSPRDMGNSKTSEEFWDRYRFLISEMFRVIMPGRLVSIHCMNLPTSKTRHGYIGIRDFRGEIIREHQKAGFIFHSEVCIWKDPVTAMQRTKALGLLHKQMVKDSCMSRQGIPDYLVTLRKPGDNSRPVDGELDRWIGDGSFKSEGRLSIDLWQRYASPVWMDINPSRTLQKESAREERDERHIAPLQLQVIERAIELWSNPGDVVLSPFAGIGSEGFVAVQNGRKFIGIELKKSYYDQACLNLKRVESEKHQDLLFDVPETVAPGA